MPVRDRVPAGKDAKGKDAQDRHRVAVVEPQVQTPASSQPKVFAYAPSADTSNLMNAESRVCKTNAHSAAPF